MDNTLLKLLFLVNTVKPSDGLSLTWISLSLNLVIRLLLLMLMFNSYLKSAINSLVKEENLPFWLLLSLLPQLLLLWLVSWAFLPKLVSTLVTYPAVPLEDSILWSSWDWLQLYLELLFCSGSRLTSLKLCWFFPSSLFQPLSLETKLLDILVFKIRKANKKNLDRFLNN